MSQGRSSFTIKTSKVKGASADIVSDTLKIRRFLLKGFHDPKAAIEFQPDGRESKFQVRVIDAAFRKDGLWIEAAELPGDLEAGVAAMFMIYSPDIGVLGFRATFVEIQDDGWVNLGSPERMVRTQKRLDPRYTIPQAYELMVSFKRPYAENPNAEPKSCSYRLFDISSTGVGFVIEDAEASYYPRGLVVKEVRMRIKGREIIAEAEVMSCLPHKFNNAKDQHKVGIRFSRITQDNQDFLRSFVVENLIQYDVLNES